MDKITSWNQVPSFETLSSEQDFWSTHEVDPALLQAGCIKNSGSESTTITLRMDPRMLARLKRLAGHRYLNYQSMLKQWVAERLEKELEGKNPQ